MLGGGGVGRRGRPDCDPGPAPRAAGLRGVAPGAALPGVNVRLWRRAAGGRFLFGLVGTWESPASSSHTGDGAGTAGVGTWLLAAWLILSRKVPFAGPEDRHESRFRKAVTAPSASRLSGSRSLASSLSLSRWFARLRSPPPPAPDQFAAVGTGSEAAGEWRGKSKCAAVSGRGAAEAGLGEGRDLARDELK